MSGSQAEKTGSNGATKSEPGAKRSDKPVGGFSVFLRLLRFARPYAPVIILGIALMSVDVSYNVAIAWIQETFIDTINSADIDRLMYLVKVCSAVSAVAMVMMFLGAYLRYWTVTLMDRDVALAVYDHVNRLPFGYVQSVHSGDLVSRASSDVGQATQVIGNNTYSLISNTAMCLLAFTYLSRIDLPLAILVVGAGPIIFGAGRFFDRRIRRLSKDIQDQSANLRGMLQEMFQGMPVIKAFGLEDSFVRKYNTERAAARDMMKRRSLMNAAMWRTVNITNEVFLLGCVSLIALAAIRGHLTVGAVLAFTILMDRVQWPFVGLSTTWGSVQQGLGAADRIFAVMDLATEDSSAGTRDTAGTGSTVGTVARATPPVSRLGRTVSSSAPGAVVAHRAAPFCSESEYALEVRDVSFSYSSGDSLFVRLNLQVRPGEIVALVGPSGGGKTTLAQICCGLRDVDEGDVKVFGISLKSDLYSARSLIAYVPQTPYLFAGTIRENISYGRDDATFEEIVEAAKAANAHDFISAFEKQYDTAIGEHGTSLSGGERQRIAIARAFLRDAPIIILDEATSSLDNESEKLVQESMDRLMRQRTALVIAHRLSTVRNASRIAVIDDGQIVEEGTHSELIRRRGLYARLYEIQFRD